VTDPARFMTEIVGTDGEFTRDEISFQIRNIIVQEASRAMAASGIPVLDMAANTGDMGRLIAAEVSQVLADYGLTMPEFYIENISLPPSVEKALDKRTSMGIVGDLGAYTRFSAAEAMTRAAENPSGGMGAAIGAGLGAGMGMAMGHGMAHPGAAQGPWGAAPARPAPPPPPMEHVWHIAENGATHGPYSRASLGRMAQQGRVTRDSLVWTAGQDGWLRAEDVRELAQLFTVMPPPPPAPPQG